MESIVIRNYQYNDFKSFRNLFYSYFNNDFRIEISMEQAEDICRRIIESTKKKITSLEIITKDLVMIGFCIYQVDSTLSDWCEKEGWGCIREFFIVDDERDKGYGKKLIMSIESKLKELGAEKCYLTSDEAGSFWIKCGYLDSGENSVGNSDLIYTKHL